MVDVRNGTVYQDSISKEFFIANQGKLTSLGANSPYGKKNVEREDTGGEYSLYKAQKAIKRMENYLPNLIIDENTFGFTAGDPDSILGKYRTKENKMAAAATAIYTAQTLAEFFVISLATSGVGAIPLATRWGTKLIDPATKALTYIGKPLGKLPGILQKAKAGTRTQRLGVRSEEALKVFAERGGARQAAVTAGTGAVFGVKEVADSLPEVATNVATNTLAFLLLDTGFSVGMAFNIANKIAKNNKEAGLPGFPADKKKLQSAVDDIATLIEKKTGQKIQRSVKKEIPVIPAELPKVEFRNPSDLLSDDVSISTIGMLRTNIKTKDRATLDALSSLDKIDRISVQAKLNVFSKTADDILKGNLTKATKQATAFLDNHPVYDMISRIKEIGGLNSAQAIKAYGKPLIQKLNSTHKGLFKELGKDIPTFLKERGIESPDELMDVLFQTASRPKAKEGFTQIFLREESASAIEKLTLQQSFIDEEIRLLTKSYLPKVKETPLTKDVAKRDRMVVAEFDKPKLPKSDLNSDMVSVNKAALEIKQVYATSNKDFIKAISDGNLRLVKELKQKQKYISDEYKKVVRLQSDFTATGVRIRREVRRRGLSSTFTSHLKPIVSKWFKFDKKTFPKAVEQAPVEFFNYLDKANPVAKQMLETMIGDIGSLQSKTVKEMSLNELSFIKRYVDIVVGTGLRDGKILRAEKKEGLAEVVGEIVASIGNLKVRFPRLPAAELHAKVSQEGGWAKISKASREFMATLDMPIFIVNALDNFKDFGPFHNMFIRPLAKAQDAEYVLMTKYLARMEKIFKPYHKGILENRIMWANKKYTIPTKGGDRTFTKEEIFGLALHSGNKYNKDAVKLGYGLSDTTYNKLLKNLTSQEWKSVNDMWQVLDDLWPLVSKTSTDLTGVAPPRVQGKFWPLKPNYKMSNKIQQKQLEADAENVFSSIVPTVRGQTKSGHRISRTAGTPTPRLDFGVFGNIVQEIIHDATHAVPINNAYKVMFAKPVRLAITETLGKESYGELLKSLKFVARPSRAEYGVDPYPSAWMATARRNITVAYLAANVAVAMKQPLSIFGAIAVVDAGGGHFVKKAVVKAWSNPWETRDFVHENSIMMLQRRKRIDFNMGLVADKFSVKRIIPELDVRDAFFYTIRAGDFFAAYPTWVGAYNKGINKLKYSHDKSVEFANMIVEMTQPVTAPKDVPSIMVGSEGKRWVTLFYSFFKTFQNQMRRLSLRREMGDITEAEAFRAYFWLIVPSAYIGETINKRRFISPREFAIAIVNYRAAGIPGLRDLVSGLSYGYQYSPALAVPETAVDLTRQALQSISEGENKIKLNTAVKAIGVGFGLPSSQALKIMQGIESQDSLFYVVVGKKQPRKKSKGRGTGPSKLSR